MAGKSYKDHPRYKVINQFEGDFKKSWKGILRVALKDVELKLNKVILNK